MRKIAYPLIWLAVTVAAVLIASAAVSSVRDQVTDSPTAMLPPTTLAISSTEQLIADPVQPEEPTSAVTADSSTTTTSSSTTTTTVQPEEPTTTSSSEPEPTETTTITTNAPTTTSPTTTTTSAPTTTTAPATEIRSYELVGGTVSVEIGNGTVRLAGASPNPGFAMEVESSGPEKVEVEFRSGDYESHFTGKFVDGRFEPSINESGREDDD
ncbi:MAG: hypothetical protein M3096_08720 [Actinomycetia bacterium]|nr:hypothetical protein [Actinomycetes bacterium]